MVTNNTGRADSQSGAPKELGGESIERRLNELERALAQAATERQQLEKALADERALLHTVIDNLPDAIYFKDTRSRILLDNVAHARAANLTPPEMVGHTDLELFPAQQAMAFYADEQAIIQSGEPLIEREEQTFGLDRKPIWALTTKVPVRDQDGQIIGIVGITRDVTRRKQAEAALQAARDNLEQQVEARTADLVKANADLHEQIARREAVEQALADERNLLRTLIDNLPDLVYVKDRQSRFVVSNQVHSRRVGAASPDDCLGKSDFDFYPLRMAEQFYRDEQAMLQSGQAIVDYEERAFERGTGTFVWHQSSKIPLRDNAGQIVGLVGITRDVTEHKQAAEILDRERRLLRTLIDNIPDYIYVKDDQGRFLVSNLAHNQAVGQSTSDALLGKTAFDFFPRSLAAQFHADDLAVIHSGQPLLNAERTTVDAEGRAKRVLTTKVPLVDHQRIIGLVGISRDITRRKQAEEALERERNWLHTLLDNLPDHIYIKDTESRFVLANHAVVDMTRTPVTLDEIIGKTDLDLDSSEQSAGYFAEEQALMQSGHPLINQELFTVDRAGRPRWLLITKVPLRDSHGAIIGLVGINRDFTQLKQAEEALAQTAQELRRSNEELQQFAYVASHDLQEPLRMITSYLQLLEKRYADKLDTDAQEFIAYAVDGAVRMKRLTNGLLDYSRVTTQGKGSESTNCEMSLLQALLNLQVAIHDHAAQVTYDPLPTVIADSAQLIAVFQNLIGNAIKFQADRPPQVHISAQKQENEWRFSVRDNGIGIAPENAERIFVIFNRLHSQAKYPGTGIGLALCKRVVERHGGRIWVESQPGEGATFFFTIPA